MEKFIRCKQVVNLGHCDQCGEELRKVYWIHELTDGEQIFMCEHCAAFVLAETVSTMKNIDFEDNL